MTLEEARRNIGQRVTYTPYVGGTVAGTIEGVGDYFVLVLKDDEDRSVPINPEQLSLGYSTSSSGVV